MDAMERCMAWPMGANPRPPRTPGASWPPMSLGARYTTTLSTARSSTIDHASVGPPALGLVLDDLSSPGPPGLRALPGGQAGGGHHGRRGSVEQIATLRDPSSGVHQDPEGGTPPVSAVPDRERGIVHERRPRSDQDGVGGGPEPMDIGTGGLASDPS